MACSIAISRGTPLILFQQGYGSKRRRIHTIKVRTNLSDSNATSASANPNPSPSPNPNPSSRVTGTGQNLWRKELKTPLDSGGLVPDDDASLDLSMRQDIEALSLKQESEERRRAFSPQYADERRKNKNNSGGGGGKGLLGSVMEKVLVADFFFILFALGWFIAGLAEKAAFDSSSLIDTWLPLWPFLFQPALGVFMAAAIFTALSNFLSKPK